MGSEEPPSPLGERPRGSPHPSPTPLPLAAHRDLGLWAPPVLTHSQPGPQGLRLQPHRCPRILPQPHAPLILSAVCERTHMHPEEGTVHPGGPSSRPFRSLSSPSSSPSPSTEPSLRPPAALPVRSAWPPVCFQSPRILAALGGCRKRIRGGLRLCHPATAPPRRPRGFQRCDAHPLLTRSLPQQGPLGPAWASCHLPVSAAAWTLCQSVPHGGTRGLAARCSTLDSKDLVYREGCKPSH